MKLQRWLFFVGGVIGTGICLVTVRNLVFLRGYALGGRVQRLQQDEMRLAWLEARVITLASPASLSDAAESNKLQLVARTTLESQESKARGFVRLAASEAVRPSD